jgi:hypothetical protein
MWVFPISNNKKACLEIEVFTEKREYKSLSFFSASQMVGVVIVDSFKTH